ncbi:MAG: hypothetical protein H6672_00865 [Anaerolineaceae bacterium]|nr:hypothetical protein [Anaerolineaceae bacterium]
MSENFLTTFMIFALQQTGAERALVVDHDIRILETVNLDDESMGATDFNAMDCVIRALDSGNPLITNNAVLDPDHAPVTNTQFRNLRLVVVIPVIGLGALYLDQPISKGVIAKEVVNRLMTLASDAVEEGISSLDDLAERYRAIP